jgi:hypothetical protein
MGTPTNCEYYDQAGNAYQETTTGSAHWNRNTDTPVFTRGNEHWAWTASGLQHGTGPVDCCGVTGGCRCGCTWTNRVWMSGFDTPACCSALSRLCIC